MKLLSLKHCKSIQEEFSKMRLEGSHQIMIFRSQAGEKTKGQAKNTGLSGTPGEATGDKEATSGSSEESTI